MSAPFAAPTAIAGGEEALRRAACGPATGVGPFIAQSVGSYVVQNAAGAFETRTCAR
jgi:hypothetical protein